MPRHRRKAGNFRKNTTPEEMTAPPPLPSATLASASRFPFPGVFAQPGRWQDWCGLIAWCVPGGSGHWGQPRAPVPCSIPMGKLMMRRPTSRGSIAVRSACRYGYRTTVSRGPILQGGWPWKSKQENRRKSSWKFQRSPTEWTWVTGAVKWRRRREWSRWPAGGILRRRAAPQRRSSALLPGSRAGYEWPNPIG